MFNQLIELYTKGDLAQLSAKILHSSAWKQHDFTAYGNVQIEKLWLKSIEQFGFLEITERQEIKGEQYSALYIELVNEDKSEKVSITFFFEHNNLHIKKLHCIFDTLALAKLLKQDVATMTNALPASDPLLLSQFDHQLHPKSYHAMPEDIVNLPVSMKDTVNKWWNIWQEKQLANFDKTYTSDALIQIAGFGISEGFQKLRNFHLKLHNRMNRSYCQLENISFNEIQSSVAIKWHVDGDYLDKGAIKRIRIPVISIITIKDGVVTKEHLQVDWLALCQQYKVSYPFI
ncbi:MAG: hypothetical protein ACJASU_000242 [Cognaticolwellia sp.]|jgi:hypothetical protein